MSVTSIKEHSVVVLKDGRTGTIVHKYASAKNAYCVEIEDDDTNDLVDVLLDDVESVIWEPESGKPEKSVP